MPLCIPDIADKMHPNMLIWPYVVLLWPWWKTFWPQNVFNFVFNCTKLLIGWNCHKQFIRYRVNKL